MPANQACVVGAGVSGLQAAKRLKAEGFQVTVYERQSDVGGVWKYTANPSEDNAGPMYDGLETNLPRELMQFDDLKWPDRISLFPEHRYVAEYLRHYERHVAQVAVQYSTTVVDIYRQTLLHPRKWRVTTQAVHHGMFTQRAKEFDIVVIAVGTFQEPFVPFYDGFEEWKALRPNSFLHAKQFRRAHDFTGRNVLVVGNSVTGRDISRLVKATARNTWVSSTRGAGPWNVDRNHQKQGIKRFDAKRGTVEFFVDHPLNARTDEVPVDVVIFCTGYRYSSPFLRKGMRTPQPLFPDGLHINDLYLHMIWTKEPTLAFVGVPKGGPSFLIAQAQAAYLARLYSPHCRGLGGSRRNLEEWVARKMVEKGLATGTGPGQDNEDMSIVMAVANLSMEPMVLERRADLHGLPFPDCRNYIHNLAWECERIDAYRMRKTGNPAPADNQVFRWTDRLTYLMENARAIRDAFLAKGERRHTFPTPESLLF